MKASVYLRDILAIIGVVALGSLAIDAYNFIYPKSVEPQKDLFDWKIVGKYPNNSNAVVAILEHGVSNTGANTAPIYRLKLQTISEPDTWLNHWNVWNSQVRQKPVIRWLDEYNLEINHVSYRVWEYEPSVKLHKNNYGVHLNVLPNKP